MATIIQFPPKKSFIDNFKGKVPDDLLEDLSKAFDNTMELLNAAPTVELHYDEKTKSAIESFQGEYKQYVLSLLSKILELEAALALSRRR